jgi:hypothetical protein
MRVHLTSNWAFYDKLKKIGPGEDNDDNENEDLHSTDSVGRQQWNTWKEHLLHYQRSSSATEFIASSYGIAQPSKVIAAAMNDAIEAARPQQKEHNGFPSGRDHQQKGNDDKVIQFGILLHDMNLILCTTSLAADVNDIKINEMNHDDVRLLNTLYQTLIITGILL